MKYQVEITKMDGTKWRNNRCGKGFVSGTKLQRAVEKYLASDENENVEIIPFQETEK